MTVQQAIDKIDSVKPNAFSIEDKVNWLSLLDGKIYEELIKTHDNFIETVENKFEGYTIEDVDEEMIVPFPYENIYIDWLEAQIDLENNDISRYNNSIQVFYNEYNDYANWYGRHHMFTQIKGWRL